MTNDLFNIKHIYYERNTLFRTERGREILRKHEGAKLTQVKSHWKIPELTENQDNIKQWNKIKREVLVLGIKKGLNPRPNARS